MLASLVRRVTRTIRLQCSLEGSILVYLDLLFSCAAPFSFSCLHPAALPITAVAALLAAHAEMYSL